MLNAAFMPTTVDQVSLCTSLRVTRQVLAHGVDDGLVTVLEVEFEEDVEDLHAHGRFADDERLGDL